MTSPYQMAKDQGYSDEEIFSYLEKSQKYSDKIKTARDQGYSNQEILDFLSSYKSIQEEPKQSLIKKGGKIAGQYALGATESALLPYELAVAPLSSKEAQLIPYKEEIQGTIDILENQKNYGTWSPEDEEFLQGLKLQIEQPNEAEKFVQTSDIGVRGLAEKATGLNLKPEGFLEHAANWTGFIKNPKNISQLTKNGLKPKDVIKAISPTGTETLKGLGAAGALQVAEDGEYGPIGTMAALVVGDILGHGVAEIGKGILKPKETLAKLSAKLTSKDKLDLQKELIKDFREAGLQADIGTITNSDIIKFTQSRLAQSGLTGRALDDLKQTLTNQIKEEYKSLSKELGEAKYVNSYEAGNAMKEGINTIREADLAVTRKLYENAEKSLKDKSYVSTNRLASAIENLEKQLKPGSLKSSEQNIVLDTLKKLKSDILDSAGNPIYANVKDLMNNKIALNDLINYEVQGGSKQLLKSLVSELDRAIISHGKENPTFAKNYINANKTFSEHAKTFRNKEISSLLKTEDPSKILNRMNTVHGIRSINKILTKSPEGKEILKGLKRQKLDQVIGDNFVDSTTNQIKFGTFSKLLQKGKNKEIIKEILGPFAYKRLERLQKNSGAIAETGQKFFNSSKTGATLEDMAIVASAFKDLSNLLAGNPWAILKTSGTILSARYLTNLIADPNFLKMVEEAILASNKNDINLLLNIGKELVDPIKTAIIQNQVLNSNEINAKNG